MKIEEHIDEARILITDHTGRRAKMLFSFEAISYAGGTISMLFIMWSGFSKGDLMPLLTGFGGAILFGIAFWRYVNRITSSEEMVIQPDVLILITHNKIKKSAIGYPVDEIMHLRYIGFEKPVDHPLKTGSFDYIGLQTQQEVVNAVMAEGNIGFEHHGAVIRFGIGVPSWDAAVLDELISRKTNGRLFIAGLPEDIPELEWNQS